MTQPVDPSQINPSARQKRDYDNTGQTPYWQQQQASREQQKESIQGYKPEASAQVDPNYYSRRLNQTQQASDIATRGTLQSVETQRREAAEEANNLWRRDQEEAAIRLQADFAGAQKKQQKEFEDRWNEMQAQVDQFGDKLSQARLKITPGQFNPAYSNMDASGLYKGSGVGTPVGEYSTTKYQQIAQWARQAGWQEKDIPMVISIAMAESGGNPGAVNTGNRNGSRDDGLMQINSIHGALRQTGNVYDPVDNLRMAKTVFDEAGGKWTPWSTFNNGAYAKFPAQPSSYIQPANLAPSNYRTAGGGLRNQIVSTAERYIGLPYVWGGRNLSTGVDCSGLVIEVYKKFGMKMGATANDQSYNGTRVDFNTFDELGNAGLQPGDLIAWQGGWRGPNYVGHIAIYAGNGEIVEAPQTGLNVRRRPLRANELGRAFGVKVAISGDGQVINTAPPAPARTSTGRPLPPNYMPWEGLPENKPKDWDRRQGV